MIGALSMTLPGGALAVALCYVLLYRLTPLNGRQAALVTALAALAGYLPVALLRWPGADVFAIHIAVYLVVAYVAGILGSQRDARRAQGQRMDGKWFHWAPALIVAFFAVIVSMDAVFVTLSMEGMPKPVQEALLPPPDTTDGARTAFPGVVPKHYFQKEAQYNAYLERMEAQRERGWRVRKGWLTERPEARRSAVLQVAVEDREGRPITGAAVQGRFLRPSDSGLDRAFTMDETSPGIYRMSLALPEPGVWHLHLLIRKGELIHEVRGSTSIYGPQP